MDKQLEDVLEKLNDYFPKPRSIQSLISDDDFSELLIKEALDKGAITTPYNMKDLLDKAMKGDKTIPVILSIQGFIILNQIRLKKATEKLDAHIKDFDTSSAYYAKRVLGLTIVLTILTAIIAVLTWKLV